MQKRRLALKMQIPTAHIYSSLIPQKSSVYERQVARLNYQRQRAEQARAENEQKRFRDEMLEMTGKPRINRNIAVQKPFMERSEYFSAQKTHHFRLLRQMEQAKYPLPSFQPQIDPASVYLAESRKALARTLKSEPSNGAPGYSLTSDYYLKTANLYPLPDHPFMPEITTLAARIPDDTHLFERLSRPKVYPATEFEVVTSACGSPQFYPTAKEYELQNQRLHAEYAKILCKRQQMAEYQRRSTQRHETEEDRIQRDILAYKARARRLSRYGEEPTAGAAPEEEKCTFTPEIDPLSKILTQNQPSLLQRYDDIVQNMREREQLNEERRRLQEEEQERVDFVPPSVSHTSADTAEFYKRYQDMLERRRYAQIQKELVERQQKISEISDVLRSCNYKASDVRPPANLHDKLLLTGYRERNQLAENLVNGSIDQKTQRILALGNNVPITAACLLDSIAHHVDNIHRGTEERRRRLKMLELRPAMEEEACASKRGK